MSASEESDAALLLRLEPSALRLSTLVKVDLRHQALSKLPLALALCGDSLEHLDVGGNPLRSLDGIEKLAKLRILFATGCELGCDGGLPKNGPLSKVSSLFMLSLKENGLKALDGECLPENLGWLICAQNEIASVHAPSRLSHVRKLMLSHNRLDESAASALISAIPELEMLRLACNRLEDVPKAALSHPRLAWLAIGGNPYADRQVTAALDAVAAAAATTAATTAAATTADACKARAVQYLPDASQVTISEVELGRGSGAVVKRGMWQGAHVACKLWTAEQFSDGDARGEWVMGRLTGSCPHLVRTLAAWEHPSLGMAVELLEGASAVGGPPNFGSVTRDTFAEGRHDRLSARQAHHIALRVARAGAWLHERGLMHGDIYLHNTLRVAAAAKDGSKPNGKRRRDGGAGADAAGEAGEDVGDVVRLSDLGAACAYDRASHPMLERLELRSFGWLVLDLLTWIAEGTDGAGEQLLSRMRRLANECTGEMTNGLTFARAVEQLG